MPVYCYQVMPNVLNLRSYQQIVERKNFAIIVDLKNMANFNGTFLKRHVHSVNIETKFFSNFELII